MNVMWVMSSEDGGDAGKQERLNRMIGEYRARLISVAVRTWQWCKRKPWLSSVVAAIVILLVVRTTIFGPVHRGPPVTRFSGDPFTEHTGWVTSVAISPDGKRIVSGSRDKTVKVWKWRFLHCILL